MLSSLDPSAQQFLTNLNKISDRMNRAQQQISTGLKITQVSDAPDSVSLLLQAHANLGSTQQILTNLGRVKTEVDGSEQALESALTMFEKVQTLGAQGNTSTQTASSRADIASQLDNLLQEIVGLAGTTVGGRYIFSGDNDQQTPYTYDATQANPISTYQGSSSTRQVQHPNGTMFSVAHTAQEIFDSADPTTNVFSAIQNLSTALKNNDSSAIQTAFDGLSAVNTHLNSELAFYGNTQDRVSDATSFGNTLTTQLQTQIGSLQDADVTQSILEMTQAQTEQQAALQARAKLPRATLFDYLG